MWLEKNIVLIIVIFISILAHVWIYRWVKFKIDEGVILNYLKGLPTNNKILDQGDTLKMLLKATEMSESRVVFVSEKSRTISLKDGSCFLMSK